MGWGVIPATDKSDHSHTTVFSSLFYLWVGDGVGRGDFRFLRIPYLPWQHYMCVMKMFLFTNVICL